MALFEETLAERIIRQRAQMDKERSLWEPIWQEIAELMYPHRSDITVMLQQGVQKTRRLFDSTALVAAERLAAAMSGTVTPATMQWFDPEIPELFGLRVPKVVHDWSDAVGKAMFRSLQNSNYDTEQQELYHDLDTFCTGALFIDEDSAGNPRFRSLHPGEYSIWTNSHNEVIRLTRDVLMSIREAVREFGREALSEEMTGILNRNEDVDREFVFTQYIARRFDEKFGFPSDNFPIVSIWLDVKSKHVVRKSGFDEWPVPVARWSTTSVERYGRGPGFTALPDVASLNKAEEFGLRAWAMSVIPPLLAMHDGILGKPDLRPGRMNFINQEGALQWFPPGTRLDVETVKREDKRKSIWNIFFMDQVQFIPDRGKTPPSAEEVRARLNIMLQILGPTLARLEHELLVPTLVRVFGILARRGKLPEAPPAVIRFAEQVQSGLDIQFVGPIARAKRQAESVRIESALDFVGRASQVWPEIIDNIDPDEMLREKFRVDMSPRVMLRDRTTVQGVRQQRQEAQAQAEQEAQDLAASQVVKNVTPAVEARAKEKAA